MNFVTWETFDFVVGFYAFKLFGWDILLFVWSFDIPWNFKILEEPVMDENNTQVVPSLGNAYLNGCDCSNIA